MQTVYGQLHKDYWKERNLLENVIDAIGSLAEILRMFVEQLQRNGFSRQEAVQLARDYMIHMLNGGTKNGQA